mgnify:CR=1 FL=1
MALCDVNQRQTAGAAKALPAARIYRDFRKMFDEMERQIDAVVVATPVNTHAVIAMAAMKLGKHVYVEKPIAHDVREARAMRDMARRQKVVTQMGSQGMATDSFRRTLELIQDGAIGAIREAHVLFESGGTGPLDRPQEQPVPESLDWDLWIGPAPVRPYHPGYLPPQFPGAGGTSESPALIGWNRWRDFGGGALVSRVGAEYGVLDPLVEGLAGGRVAETGRDFSGQKQQARRSRARGYRALESPEHRTLAHRSGRPSSHQSARRSSGRAVGTHPAWKMIIFRRVQGWR